MIVQMQEEITSIMHPTNGDTKNFAFDFSIWSTHPSHKHFRGQQYVYENLGKQLLESAFEGYNACLFAYGQTRSGKTYPV